VLAQGVEPCVQSVLASDGGGGERQRE
jgi:hypothetical protein